ncbi:MAG: OmpA family protein [Nitrospirota bacterium]
MIRIVLFALSVSLFFSNVALAADMRWYLTPGAAYIMEDKDRDADNSIGFQLGVGKPISDNLNIELTAVLDSLPRDWDSSEFDQTGLLLDALYFFSHGQRISTYGVLGGGVLQTRFKTDKGIAPMVNAGIGVMSRLWKERVGLRGDIRYRIDERNLDLVGEKSFGDWIVNVGFVVPIGGGISVGKKSFTGETTKKIKLDLSSGSPIVLKGVNFELGSDRLLPESLPILDEVAATLQKHSKVSVELAGHTDNSGPAEFNQGLSQRRAASVMEYLIGKGVSKDRLQAAGYGSQMPIADNGTPEGMAQNRRVELNVLKK